MSRSPLHQPEFTTKWAEYDVDKANALLDEIGLTERNKDGIRLMSDGRPLEIIVETSGEDETQLDALELIAENWAEIGVKLFAKPSQRDNLRERAITGELVMSVWWGMENGIPTADMSPNDLAPVQSESLTWHAWGDHYETKGVGGEPMDWAPAQRLMELYQSWLVSKTSEEREKIWQEMLQIHAEETIRIGLVSGVRQPVVIKGVKNVPLEGIYGWDPGAHYGIHRMDEFYMDE